MKLGIKARSAFTPSLLNKRGKLTVSQVSLFSPLLAPAMASSSPSPSNGELLPPPSDSESQLSSLIYDLSSQVQVAMENMLKMISEIDQSSAEICEEIEKCKGYAFERKKVLEDERENFQKAAYAVIDMLNNRAIS